MNMTFKPTHQYSATGLNYMKVADGWCKERAVQVTIYRNEKGDWYTREKSDFDRKFILLPVHPSQGGSGECLSPAEPSGTASETCRQ